uniref:Zgc:56231 n=1 Tax=Poecilia reticulata TaxID=8081 RepID=A0A3P9NV23_POERE
MSSGAEQQMMQIYLRVRPFSKEELSANEDQVFGPQTTQGELFEDAVRSQVFDFLEGENALIFSYGVTNAGKTFTIQGTPKHPGILPRVLDAQERTFALWVAFFEIYNECVYDLLQPSQSKKRSPLRVYLKWINIQNLSEANKLLQFGNKNRSAAATKINQSSSRSHSIFTMKFSLCDLAGSERCNKAKTFGERLKEAGNINNSLLILGKCISALRSSQVAYIPFRESKLTKLFQAFFCGKGRAAMIVNINQCASTYDETLHIMKFSAVAKQVSSGKWTTRSFPIRMRLYATSHVQDDFLEKSDDVEALRKTVDEQVRRCRRHGQSSETSHGCGRLLSVKCFVLLPWIGQQSKSMGEILCQNAEKDKEIASLKAEIEKLSQKSPVQLKTKTRRGLLANIKEVVSSPRRGPSSNSLVKPPRTPKY